MNQKRLILVKEGLYSPSLFADFGEFINKEFPRNGQTPLLAPTTISFFHKSAYTFQLVRNVRAVQPRECAAISHYTNNAFDPSANIALFKPLDLDVLCESADKFGAVLCCAVQNSPDITSSNVLEYTAILARDPDTLNIIDVVSHDIHRPDAYKFIPVIAFFGLIKLANLPVYYLFTDSKMLTVGGGLDISNAVYDIKIITDHDGLVKDNVVTPTFTPNVEALSNNTLYVTGDAFTISLFEKPYNVLKLYNVDMSNVTIDVKSNLTISSNKEGSVQFNIPNGVTAGYVKLKISCGIFLDSVSSTESLVFEYSVVIV